MSQYFEIHPDNPQKRLIHQAVAIIEQGGVIVYPTDSSYALGCHIGNKSAMERIQRIRQLGKDHNFTLVCRDLSEIALYAKVNNSQYRTIRALTPGPYTFIFKATHEVPRRLLNPKRKTIGIRVPDHDIANALLEALGQPLMSSTLILPESDQPMNDAYEIRQMLEKQVDLIIDGGNCGIEPTTVIVMEDGQMDVVRKGKGDVSLFE
ncbi:MAG: threonylcarbamoyl-AMP synthase [Gammaproteobacteria bacterium]|nr:threonylcarbamoyl-AMP synthase [Gammaproteobacteria bacterium]